MTRTLPIIAGLLLATAATYGATMSSFGPAQARQTEALDFEGIKTLRIRGHDAALHLRTGAAGASIDAQNTGRRGCEVHVAAQRSGETLTLTVAVSDVAFFSRCQPKVAILMPADVNVAIDMEKTHATLAGGFGTLALTGRDAVFTLDGTATRVDLDADLAVVKLQLGPEAAAPGAVRLSARKMTADIGLPRGATVGYDLSVPLMVFNHGMPSSDQPTTRIAISAELLQGSVHPVRG